jgi:hypothetical protein
MNLIYILTLLVQAGLIIHCIKTGRNTIWIWALMLLPGAGAIAYVVVEVLPGLFGSRGAKRAVRGVRRALDPQQDLRRLESAARVQGGVATQQHYAEELVRQGRGSEAIEVYRQTLRGLYEHDPNLMLGLAQAQFTQGLFAESRATLDELIARNTEFKSPAGHLLYARALEGEGNTAKALEEYRALTAYFAGAEAPVRYAQLLQREGQRDEARRVLSELTDHARHAPHHYRKTQAEWLAMASRQLSSL